MRSLACRLFCVCVLLFVATFTLAGCHQPGGHLEGKAAPALEVEEVVQGALKPSVSWADLQGKVVVLEFWATWCPPCVATMPHLDELAQQMQGKDVQFIAVSNEERATVEAFLKDHPSSLPIALDTDSSMFESYGVRTIPRTVIVDRGGKVHQVAYPTDVNADLLEKVLAQPAADR